MSYWSKIVVQDADQKNITDGLALGNVMLNSNDKAKDFEIIEDSKVKNYN